MVTGVAVGVMWGVFLHAFVLRLVKKPLTFWTYAYQEDENRGNWTEASSVPSSVVQATLSAAHPHPQVTAQVA